MMHFKPFYVHRYSAPGKLPNREPRAFTALISPKKDDHTSVLVQVTFCNPKDQFCKRIGREMAALTEKKPTRKKDLPRLLGALCEVCNFDEDEHNFYYVWKYVV